MDIVGWALLGWLVISLLFLLGVETYCVMNNLPTISDRVRGLGDTRIVLVLTTFIVGYLAAHFWDRSGKKEE